MQHVLTFTKMQGVGNDFVVVDGFDKGDWDWSALAVELCDRRFGVGADGLLVVEEAGRADLQMRMYNPDGTPDVCGNGLRCVARYAVERKLVSSSRLSILTLAGVRDSEVNRNGSGDIVSVTVVMGEPRMRAVDIPMTDAGDSILDYPLELANGYCIPISAVNTGSSHVVTFVSELPDDDRFFALSPLVEHHELFPERVSIMWAARAADGFNIRIWERGAGETWGCGTGACAVGVTAVLHNFVAAGELVKVHARGGTLEIRWTPGSGILMTGPAENVFEGSITLSI
jgi:diaminopimelate epimerase